nr:RNA polymerase sporulation sigma factor SigH [uncultured Peptostreptococcus sp.]
MVEVGKKKDINIELEPKDEFEIIGMAKLGNSQAIENIIDRYSILVKAKAKTYFLVGADKEDIIQEGLIGLYKAIRDYNQENTCSFKHFADICITRQIITAIKTATRQKHIPLNTYISLNKPIFDDDSERNLFETIRSNIESDPEKMIILKEEYQYIQEKMAEVLSKFEQEVLGKYLSGKTYREISVELDKEPKSIDNALQRIKKKMDNFIERDDLSVLP